MPEFLTNLLSAKQFIPHGHCYLWKPGLVWLHIASDLLIALAYYSIPIMLIYFVRQRRDVPFDWIFLLFSSFIVACGTTHVMEVWTLWHPTYWLSGLLKAITAVVSLYTAAELCPLIPQALALPSPAQLEATNNQLMQEISDRTKAEAALLESQKMLQLVMDNIPQLLCWKDRDFIYLGCNRKLAQTTGFKNPEDVVGRTYYDLAWSIEQADFFRQYDTRVMETDTPEYHIIEPIHQKDGKQTWFSANKIPLHDDQENVIGILVTVEDITERKHAEDAVEALRHQNEVILNSAGEGIYGLNLEGNITFVNPAATKMIGCSVEELISQHMHSIIHHSKPDGTHYSQQECLIYAALKDGVIHHVDDEVFWRKDGTSFPVEYISNPILERGEIVGAVVTFRDITERLQAQQAQKQAYEELEIKVNERTTELRNALVRLQKGITERKQTEAALLRAAVVEATNQKLETEIIERKRAETQLLHNAFHDTLTSLPNRALFIDRLGHAIERTKRRENCLFAVLFLDLDRFKVINDSLGHIVGDELLLTLAQRLTACLRSEDTVARFGEDEFTILLEDIQDISEATQVAERIQTELTRPFVLNEHEVFSTVSIGIALSSSSYHHSEELLRDADIAMYCAKNLGRARYAVFDPVMHTKAVGRLQLETNLRRALEQQGFQLYYQPIISLQTSQITGVEALVRWQHPERGLLCPSEFISVAEETGLIIPLGRWVLEEACRQMCIWHKQFPTQKGYLTLSVNLSVKQFIQPDLVKQVAGILRQTGLDAGSLKLEITESVIVENTEAATLILLELKALGVQLCMDDFGTGYSSLSYLHRFPIDILKIDQSFVSNMTVSEHNLQIIQAIVTLAHNLGVAVTAEGVETSEQLAQLKGLKCEFVQGYFFSYPVESSAVAALIAEQHAKPIAKAGQADPDFVM